MPKIRVLLADDHAVLRAGLKLLVNHQPDMEVVAEAGTFGEAIRLASLRSFGPAGTYEQDDIDNWQECTQTAKGVISRSQVVNLQMGLGQERFDPALGGWTSDFCTSECNQRHFYRHWAKLMSTTKETSCAHCITLASWTERSSSTA